MTQAKANPVTIKRLRARLPHHLSEEVASCAGLHLADLQQFVAGSFTPNQEQTRRLCLRLGIPERPSR